MAERQLLCPMPAIEPSHQPPEYFATKLGELTERFSGASAVCLQWPEGKSFKQLHALIDDQIKEKGLGGDLRAQAKIVCNEMVRATGVLCSVLTLQMHHYRLKRHEELLAATLNTGACMSAKAHARKCILCHAGTSPTAAPPAHIPAQVALLALRSLELGRDEYDWLAYSINDRPFKLVQNHPDAWQRLCNEQPVLAKQFILATSPLTVLSKRGVSISDPSQSNALSWVRGIIVSNTIKAMGLLEILQNDEDMPEPQQQEQLQQQGRSRQQVRGSGSAAARAPSASRDGSKKVGTGPRLTGQSSCLLTSSHMHHASRS